MDKDTAGLLFVAGTIALGAISTLVLFFPDMMGRMFAYLSPGILFRRMTRNSEAEKSSVKIVPIFNRDSRLVVMVSGPLVDLIFKLPQEGTRNWAVFDLLVNRGKIISIQIYWTKDDPSMAILRLKPMPHPLSVYKLCSMISARKLRLTTIGETVRELLGLMFGFVNDYNEEVLASDPKYKDFVKSLTPKTVTFNKLSGEFVRHSWSR